MKKGSIPKPLGECPDVVAQSTQLYAEENQPPLQRIPDLLRDRRAAEVCAQHWGSQPHTARATTTVMLCDCTGHAGGQNKVPQR